MATLGANTFVKIVKIKNPLGFYAENNPNSARERFCLIDITRINP